MKNLLLGREIREEDLVAGYFFHGEETFLARQLVRDLEAVLFSPDAQGPCAERFDLPAARWRDILDVARTVPFFFSPWRLLVVEAGPADSEEMTRAEEKSLRDYFASPAPKTVLIVVFPGKIRKTKPLFRVFSSFPSSTVLVRELKSLKGEKLVDWIDKKVAAMGKRVSSEALERLCQIVGSDLERLDGELEKLVTYIGDRRMIELADVNEVSDWVKTFLDWELTASLESRDLEKSLLIISKRFEEGDRPEHVLSNLVQFFRDVLTAKSWLRGRVDRREIFKTLRPQITERMGKFFWDRYRAFFGLVDRVPMKTIRHLVAELEQTDWLIKTTEAVPQALLESLLYEYCRRRK
jgi:DNA polymerase-3 subunit delta